MRVSLKTALLFSIGWIALKLIFWKSSVFQDDILVPGLINSLFLLLAISIGLYLEKKKEGFGAGTALTDIKNGMTAGAPYIVIVSAFMYFYYNTINPEFLSHKVEERMDMFYSNMERETYTDSLRVKHLEFEALTNEEIIRKAKEDAESNLSPKSIFVFSLLGLLILAFTYAIFIVLIFRKILFKNFYPKTVSPQKEK